MTTEFLWSSITPESNFCSCGEVLTGRGKYCSNECYRARKNDHSARTKKRANNVLEFVGVDGEGVTFVQADGSEVHRYVMLSVGDETLWADGRELDHRDIFPFLYECFRERPHAAYVGFFLGYDFALWLKSLPEYKGHKLLHPAGIASRKRTGKNPRPWPVDCDGWEFDILPNMKRFMLRPIPTVDSPAEPWMYICDTGPFHQAAFMTVIEPTEKNWPNGTAPCTPEEYADISAGKGNRANRYAEGDLSWRHEMERYNRLENDILARVMKTLNEGFVATGVQLPARNWYGPGQAIQQWLGDQEKERGLHLSREKMEESVPKFVHDIGREAYYGGRFELFAHGHVPGPSFEYDITSAYPHAMRNLPCLCLNSWTGGAGDEDIPENADVVFVHGLFGMKGEKIGGLPFRTPKGEILYPSNVIGWYLASEVSAGVTAGIISEEASVIDEWIAHTPCGHPPPLLGIASLYELRKEVGKATPRGKALKLMFNSAYGKFAQSIGTPRFGNSVYASMITSKCREMILEAIGSHSDPESLLMVATDAVYFRTPHDGLEALNNKDELGGWEPGRKSNLTLMKPGVYWDDKARTSGKVSVKSRGISAKALSEKIPDLDEKFRVVGSSGLESDLPRVLDMTVPFSIVSPRLALARGKWSTCGKVETDTYRADSVSLRPKRERLQVDGDILRSHMRALAPEKAVSTPYDRRFGYLGEVDELSDLLTPEGPVLDAWAFEVSDVRA